jgi:hypothetical protein
VAFSGDLEHLSVIDVVQLMYGSQKSGTLTFRGQRGECQLVFSNGYIVSANHCDNNIRIGQILLDAKLITPEVLEETLREQRESGSTARPLIAMLIEKGRVKKEIAFRGLETLILMTIVEILTWRKGTFLLDPETAEVADDYRYFPEQLHQEVQFHTESVLMDAIRIFDEKRRDGDMTEEAGPITADDLGLADVESLDRKIPGVYRGLEAVTSPVENQGARATSLFPWLTAGEQRTVAEFLRRAAARPAAEDRTLSVVCLTADALVAHLLTTALKAEGILVFATTEVKDLEPILGQSRERQGLPVLLLDVRAPGATGPEVEGLLGRLLESDPRLSVIWMVPGGFPLPTGTGGGGVATVLAGPAREQAGDAFVTEAVRFAESLPSRLRDHLGRQAPTLAGRLRKDYAALMEQKEVGGVAQALLRIAAGTFPRALTLILKEGELLSEKGVGLKQEELREALPCPGLHIPLDASPLLAEVVRSGRCRLGSGADPGIGEHLQGRIGAPRSPLVLLLPLAAYGKTVSVTYADFGRRESPPPLLPEQWELLGAQAATVLENVLFRKRLEKTPT